MNKRKVVAIIVLMVVALGSLIAMQAYWINNALALRAQQFQNSVSEALLSIAQKVEEREARKLMQSNSWVTNNMTMTQQGMDMVLQGTANTTEEAYWMDEDGLEQVLTVDVMPEVDLNVDTILAIDSMCQTIYKSTVRIQVNDSVKTFTITHSNRKKLEEEMYESRRKMASKMDQVNDLFFQYFGIDREVNDRISEDELKELIDTELRSRNITTPYEFLVLNSVGAPVINRVRNDIASLPESGGGIISLNSQVRLDSRPALTSSSARTPSTASDVKRILFSGY